MGEKAGCPVRIRRAPCEPSWEETQGRIGFLKCLHYYSTVCAHNAVKCERDPEVLSGHQQDSTLRACCGSFTSAAALFTFGRPGRGWLCVWSVRVRWIAALGRRSPSADARGESRSSCRFPVGAEVHVGLNCGALWESSCRLEGDPEGLLAPAPRAAEIIGPAEGGRARIPEPGHAAWPLGIPRCMGRGVDVLASDPPAAASAHSVHMWQFGEVALGFA